MASTTSSSSDDQELLDRLQNLRTRCDAFEQEEESDDDERTDEDSSNDKAKGGNVYGGEQDEEKGEDELVAYDDAGRTEAKEEEVMASMSERTPSPPAVSDANKSRPATLTPKKVGR